MKVFKTISISGFGKKYMGKVRDYYIVGGKRILITTDRISAFDVILGYIPHKGQVLNQLAAFWFDKTKDIIDNHLISIPDPNVAIAKNAILIPIEMVVRGYITGVTGTSIWGSYEKGERTIYGIKFPDGLSKNQKLPKPVITPTTKAEKGHDERLTKNEIIKRNLVSKTIYEQMEKISLALFQRGTKICEKAGIILVDTKYEFGLYNNKLLLIDEMHTPDSSRFWIKKIYQKLFSSGKEPENFDKEFLRLWYKTHGYTGDPSASSGQVSKPPKIPKELVDDVSKRYRDIYEKITGKKFIIHKQTIKKRIISHLKTYFQKQTSRLAVLISNKGTGTNLQAIIDAIKQKKLSAVIAVVISDEEDAYGLTRARKHRIKTEINKRKEDLLLLLKKYNVDFVSLAGWKQIIPSEVIKIFHEKILNVHPGLIPDSLDGTVLNPDKTNALWNKGKFTEKAIQNFFDYNATYAGSSIHFLSDHVDFGKVLARSFVKIKKNDTVDSLYERVKKKEHEIYVYALQKLCNT